MKRFLACLLATATLTVCSVPSAFAASEEALSAANSLYSLGLFQGTGTNSDGSPSFDLDRAPTRNEAVTMLVRLLGQEKEATGHLWTLPFSDVTSWAKPYIGFAFANKLTSGTSLYKFSGNNAVSTTQYLTFVLRALGYESGVDFQWDQAWELSDRLGITKGQYNVSSPFTRGDVALISYHALSSKPKGSSKTLLETLQSTKSSGGAASADDMLAILEPYEKGIALIIQSMTDLFNNIDSVTEWSELLTLCHREQSQIRQAANYFTSAAQACRNFSDTQNLKYKFLEISALYSTVSNHDDITIDNIFEYEDYQSHIQSLVDEILKSIDIEIDGWIITYPGS